MYTERYPNGLCWRHDGAGEGPAGTAPRQGRTRAHPQRVTAAVPRPGHQPHRHGPALRGGPGIEAHGLPALHRQGRARRRVPAPIRSDVMPAVFDRTDLTPRERLLAAFEAPATGTQDIPSLCPFIATAVEIPDPQHPATQYARDYKKAVAARLAETAREAGATNPEQLGE